ncbi:MAG: glycosyltransferase family 4 protein, partial [Chloroflexi bacterium]|nr:glycosyltransferase family 4 protein [Chloroflexota bacterium]
MSPPKTPQKLKILMLSWEYPPHIVGGLGKHATEIVPSLVKAGLEVHLVTPRWVEAKSRESAAGAEIYRVRPPSGQLTDYYDTAWKANLILEEYARRLWKSAGPFSLIHAHDWLVGFAACNLKRHWAIPLVSTIHATEMGRAGEELRNQMQKSIHDAEWWLTYESARVICASQFMAQEVRKHFLVSEEKLRVIPNGVHGERFQALSGEDLVQFRLRFAELSQPLVLFVGRLVHEKGAQILVE